MTTILKADTLTDTQTADLARALDNGAIAVFATDTVYGIGAGAFCETAVQKIYTIKKRPATQPLQILTADVAQAGRIARFSPPTERVAQVYWPGGLTLILPPTQEGKTLLRGAAGLGIRVPAYEPLRRVLAQMRGPLCSTSANLHGQPVLTDESSVLRTFDGLVDFVLLDGTLSPTASSVLDVTVTPARLLREGSILKQDLVRVYGAPIL